MERGIQEVFRAIDAMVDAGVINSYAVGGAVGATFYLEPAATIDIDIFVSLPVRNGLVSLAPIYDYLRKHGGNVDREFVVLSDWPVQFLPAADALDEEALRNATATEVEGVPIRVMSAEHLAAIALRTGRAKDHNRILQFLEQDALDRAKLAEIVKRHGLSERWAKFESVYLSQP